MKIYDRKGNLLHEVTDADSMRSAVVKLVAREANLARADLAGAHLARARLAWAQLAGADLAGAHLAGVHLPLAQLAGADLAGAELAGAYLAGANLVGADLYGANLYGVNLGEVNLTGAKNVYTSHDVASAILVRAATTEEQERYAAWPLVRRDLCTAEWHRILNNAPSEIQKWARSALLAEESWGFGQLFGVQVQ